MKPVLKELRMRVRRGAPIASLFMMVGGCVGRQP
jgi:hypothetical protein